MTPLSKNKKNSIFDDPRFNPIRELCKLCSGTGKLHGCQKETKHGLKYYSMDCECKPSMTNKPLHQQILELAPKTEVNHVVNHYHALANKDEIVKLAVQLAKLVEADGVSKKKLIAEISANYEWIYKNTKPTDGMRCGLPILAGLKEAVDSNELSME